MAPIKFEEHIKEKLDSREIQPGAGSWEKLNARLDKAEDKNNGKGLWITSIAAVMVLLIAGIFYINQQKNESPALVEEPVKAEEKIGKPEQNSFELPTQFADNENTIDDNQDSIEDAFNTKVAGKKEPVLKKNNAVVVTTQNSEDVLEPIVVENSGIILEEDGIISAKIEELIASTANNNQNVNTTDAEVDALLMQAAREISKGQYQINYDRVDAASLLAGTEREIDESFRKEVFEKLKENFLKAKTAVATRND